jgi:hypothetical protein
MSTSKCSANVADNAAAFNPKPVGQESYGYPHGSDPMANAGGALNAYNNRQSRLVKHHSGGGSYSTGDEMPVPQNYEFNAASPTGPTSANAHHNLVKLTGNRQSIYDNDAYCDTTAGGGRRSRRHRRRSRRGKKHKYTKVKKVRKYKKTKKSRKRRKSRKGRKGRRSTMKVIRNFKW